MKDTYKVWLLIALFSVPYFINIGKSSLWDINEAFYAEAPREMIQARDFITPRFNFHFRLEKPILSYWAVLPFYYFLGPSEFAERLPIAIVAALTIAITYGLGARLFNRRAGLYSALILATSFKVFWVARRSIIDMLLLLFVTLALWLAVLGLDEKEKNNRLYLLLFYAAMAMGTLVKGLLGVIIPSGVLGLYVLLTRNFALLQRLKILPGTVVYLAVVAPWYVAMFLRHGWQYFDFFFGGQHMQRYLHGTYSAVRPIWFYVPTVLAGFMPWSLFLIPALVYGFNKYRKKSIPHPPSAICHLPSAIPSGLCPTFKQKFLFLGAWVLFLFLFFSPAKGKQEEYMLQIYPALALLVGSYFQSLRVQSPQTDEEASATLPRALLFFSILAAALFAGAGVVYFSVAGQLFGRENFLNVVPMIVLSMGAVFLCCMLALKKASGIFPVVALSTLLLGFSLTAVALPQYERYRPVRTLAEKINELAKGDDAIGCYKISLPSLCFYTGRPIFEIVDDRQMQALLCSPKRTFCLMAVRDYQGLQRQGACSLYVLASKPKMSTTLKDLFAFWRYGTLNQLLLVSNQT